jgi:MFS family permease
MRLPIGPLDGLNFFLADVRDGLGPYLAIYLLTVRHWDEASIGVVMSVAGIAAVAANTPAGLLVDAVRAKRLLLAAAAAVVAAACLAMPVVPRFWPIALLQGTVGAASAIFAPAIAVITLGLVGHARFARRTGRNEAFNHAGNAFAAAAAGGAALAFGPLAVFGLVAMMACASLVAVLRIPGRAIDHDLARGLGHGVAEPGPETPSGWRVILECRPLLVFASCVALFHLANAAMLPLVGQKLALTNRGEGTALMSACIIGAQLVMVPMAMLAGAKADRRGRKPLFLAGFAVLPLRGVLYTLSDDPWWLLGVQLLDGVGAGLYGALFPLVVADLARGTGRFNAALGAVATAQGIGAALSTSLAGLVVVRAGYDAAFLALGGVALVAFVLFLVAMPETRAAAHRGGAPASMPAAAE